MRLTKPITATWQLALVICAVACAPVARAAYTYAVFDLPGAWYTSVLALNENGDVVGS